MPSPNEWDYELETDDPMLQALQRARGGDAPPPQSAPDTTGTADDAPDKTTQLPETDFSDPGSPERLGDLQMQRGGGTEPQKPPASLANTTPQEAADDGYHQALQQIRSRLREPTPDLTAGYDKAKAQDDSDNTFSKALAYMNAAIRRAPTPTFEAPTTHAADFFRRSQMQQQGDDRQMGNLEKLASITKPKAASASEQGLQAQRDYLVKIGAATPDEVATMGQAGLKTVYENYGLKHRQTEEAGHDARHEVERKQDLEWRDVQHKDAMANAEATRALTLRGQEKLPAGEAAKLGDADAAIKAVDDLSKDWDAKASKTGSGALQYIPGTDANTYLPSLRTSTQTVGTFLEGGKLTDADVPKYERMMPQPTDTAAQKEAKVAALKRLIANRRAAEGKSMQGAGYNVPGGKIRVSNGKETLLIDPADETAAAHDGYKRVGG